MKKKFNLLNFNGVRSEWISFFNKKNFREKKYKKKLVPRKSAKICKKISEKRYFKKSGEKKIVEKKMWRKKLAKNN